MAEDKKGFLLYADQKELFSQLPNEKAGELIKHIFSYVNDENPTTSDLIINLAFTPIKQQLKRDLTKYEDKIDKKSISGREGNLKRWHLDLYNSYKSGIYTLDETESIAQGRKVSHTDKVPSQEVANIAVNDTVNDTVTDKDINNTITPTAKAVKGIDFKQLLSFINKTLNKNFRTINPTMQSKFKARLKDGYTKEDIQKAIIGASKASYHIETSYRHLRPEFFTRADKIDMYSNTGTIPTQGLSIKEQSAHIKNKGSGSGTI